MILATGIVDKAPAMNGLREAIAAGLVRLCPVCDAYEAKDRHIGVAGPEQLALKEALFLRGYSRHVAILANYPHDLSDDTRKTAVAAGIGIWDTVDNIIPQESSLSVVMADGEPPRRIDTLYPAMGCDVRSQIAKHLGADCDHEGYIVVNQHLETSIAGLYAAGDVVRALNQIAVAFGHAAIAATHIHRSLPSSQSLGSAESSSAGQPGFVRVTL